MAMYEHILITLENSAADETIIDHIKPLAQLTGAKLLLVHVADGWAARNFNQLNLVESEEIKADRAYLKTRCEELVRDGFMAEAVLAMGEPSEQIIKLSQERHVDLIAMATHGHRFLKDMLLGQTVEKVRHTVEVPVLLLKARTRARI
jgi:nucleotide-binding universal stress UspA family protein